MFIYVASSYRNTQYRAVMERIKDSGHKIYDWALEHAGMHTRDKETNQARPAPHLAAIMSTWMFKAISEAKAFVLVMPCGNAAHTELGYYLAMHGYNQCILLADKSQWLDDAFYAQMVKFSYREIDNMLDQLARWGGLPNSGPITQQGLEDKA